MDPDCGRVVGLPTEDTEVNTGSGLNAGFVKALVLFEALAGRWDGDWPVPAAYFGFADCCRSASMFCFISSMSACIIGCISSMDSCIASGILRMMLRPASLP
jgi:hypothetical protein